MSRSPTIFPPGPPFTSIRTPAGVRLPVRIDVPGLVRTARVVLRPLTSTDRSEFLRVLRLSRGLLAGCADFVRPGETDEQVFERHVGLTHEGERRANAWRRGAFLHDHTLVGCFNVNGIVRGLTPEGECTWWVSADQMGRGLGTEAAGAMLDHALTDLPRGLGLQAVHAMVMAANVASAKVAAGSGMVRTGERRSVFVGSRWEWHDVWTRRAA